MSKLPTIPELIEKKIDLREKLDIYNQIVNQEPSPDWIKTNPFAQNAKYIPIERIEWLLLRLFKDYRVEVLKTHVIANTACCDVRVHVQHPITNEWTFNDGVGGWPIATSQGAGPMEWEKVLSSSVQQALPAAKSQAITDASHHFGKIFGRDLNRKQQILYSSMVSKSEADRTPGELITSNQFKELRQALNEADIPDDEIVYYNKLIGAGEINWEEYQVTLAYLQSNRKDRIARGDLHSNKDIQQKLDSHT